MILVYPMLVSGNISPNVLPGIIKTLEKFILVYGMDEALKAANIGRGRLGRATQDATKIIVSRSKLMTQKRMKGLGESFLFEDDDEFINEVRPNVAQMIKQSQRRGGSGGGRGGGSPTKTINYTQYGQGGGGKPDKPKSDAPKLERLSVGPGYSVVSLEPTWVSFESSEGVKLLGLKVVPFMLQKDVDPIAMIKNDLQLKKASAMVETQKRSIIKLIWRLGRFLKIPFIKEKALTGDPEKDILWASTLYKKRVFLLLSQMDIDRDNLFTDPKSVLKLFKMGWSSIVVADDVNKQATFCMKEFGGLCSAVPYGFMYASLGRDQMKVYEDLEDVRRSAGPFFKQKISMRQMMGESIAYERYKLYESYISEDLDATLNRIGFNKINNIISKISKSPENIKSLVKGLPSVSMKKIEQFAAKTSNKFKTNYQKTKTVLQNSTDLPGNVIDKAALLLSFGGTHDVENPDPLVKAGIATYVAGARQLNSMGVVTNTFLNIVIYVSLAAAVAIIVDQVRSYTSATRKTAEGFLREGTKNILRNIYKYIGKMTATKTRKYLFIAGMLLLLVIILSKDA